MLDAGRTIAALREPLRMCAGDVGDYDGVQALGWAGIGIMWRLGALRAPGPVAVHNFRVIVNGNAPDQNPGAIDVVRQASG